MATPPGDQSKTSDRLPAVDRSTQRPSPSDRTSGSVRSGMNSFSSTNETGVRVEGKTVLATLAGVPRVSIADVVYPHQLDTAHPPKETRVIALFDLKNVSNRPIRWSASQTSFIGSDAYTYSSSALSLDPGKLGPGCHTRSVSIEPGRKARIATLVEKLPPDVEIVEAVHTVGARRNGTLDRLHFRL